MSDTVYICDSCGTETFDELRMEDGRLVCSSCMRFVMKATVTLYQIEVLESQIKHCTFVLDRVLFPFQFRRRASLKKELDGLHRQIALHRMSIGLPS